MACQEPCKDDSKQRRLLQPRTLIEYDEPTVVVDCLVDYLVDPKMSRLPFDSDVFE